MLRFATASLAANLEPMTWMAWGWGPMNRMPAASTASAKAALKAALARDDLFTVVIDLFGTDSADFADIVLPAASFLEFDDLVCSYMHLSVSAQAKAMEPVGEALPNQEIFRRLARAMGLTEPALQEGDRPIIDRLLAASGLGVDFDRLKAVGTVPVSPEPVMLFGDLRFATPSGRIEIASARAAAEGFPAVPQPWTDPAPAEGRLRLSRARRQSRCHPCISTSTAALAPSAMMTQMRYRCRSKSSGRSACCLSPTRPAHARYGRGKAAP